FQNRLGADPVRLPDHRAESRDDGDRVAVLHEPLELRERLLEPVVVDRGAGGTHDLRVRGRAHLLALVPEHLVDLLAGEDAREDDRHLVLVATGQPDHLLREVEDADRLAHVQHVDLAPAAHRARLDDERRRLRDRHEEARHLGMTDRDGAAALDLPPEDRDHGAGRAEHVAEADGDEAGRHVLAQGERLDDPLAHGLRLAHDVHGVRGLVGRDEDEPVDASFDRRLDEVARAEDVVRDRLQRVRLEHADVLVRGGVEDDLGPVALEDLPHLRPVAAVREHGDGGGEVALVDELALDLEERRLTLLDEDEPRGAEPGELPAELRADRAAGAADGTVFPFTYEATRSRSTSTCWRPSTSSTWTGRIWRPRSRSPEMSSCSPGSVFTGTFAARQVSTTLWRTAPGADGIAISTSSGRLSRSRWPRSSLVPSTRTPWMRSPRLRGSSSTNPMGV